MLTEAKSRGWQVRWHLEQRLRSGKMPHPTQSVAADRGARTLSGSKN
jgi:hypothetical protein